MNKYITIFLLTFFATSLQAKWSEPNQKIEYLRSHYSTSVACSADGKIVYMVTTVGLLKDSNVNIYKSTDGGETWAMFINDK